MKMKTTTTHIDEFEMLWTRLSPDTLVKETTLKSVKLCTSLAIPATCSVIPDTWYELCSRHGMSQGIIMNVQDSDFCKLFCRTFLQNMHCTSDGATPRLLTGSSCLLCWSACSLCTRDFIVIRWALAQISLQNSNVPIPIAYSFTTGRWPKQE